MKAALSGGEAGLSLERPGKLCRLSAEALLGGHLIGIFFFFYLEILPNNINKAAV